jgi:hypothetical protein
MVKILTHGGQDSVDLSEISVSVKKKTGAGKKTTRDGMLLHSADTRSDIIVESSYSPTVARFPENSATLQPYVARCN